ncbi:unnamed protein product [Ilex paraguariensis]|uniref:Protein DETOXIFICATION n=1 Tax=Ilex paraguariensis TaxID=185542 RepID=A0ABC8SL55_9AQUA
MNLYKRDGLLIGGMEGDTSEKLLRKAGGAEDGCDGEHKLKNEIWRETKKLWVVAGPAIFTRFSTFGINVISQAFVGHIGATELAAYALVATVLLRFANGILVTLPFSFCCFRLGITIFVPLRSFLALEHLFLAHCQERMLVLDMHQDNNSAVIIGRMEALAPFCRHCVAFCSF